MFLDLVKKRCSIRDYDTNKPIEGEKLDYVLEAARLAPSACNLQPWYMVVITSEEEKEKICACYARDWMKTASTFILICGDRRASWKRASDAKDHVDVDVAIAIEHICLAAAEQDLGTCWVCNFDTVLCTRAFGLPEGVEPVAILPIGYPANKEAFATAKKSRKPMDEIVKQGHF